MDEKDFKVYSYQFGNKGRSTFLEWILNIIGYALVLISVSAYFPNNLYIESIFIGIVTSAVISVLNFTIKPILLILTLPISIITLGLFYPVLNVIILNIADFILGDSFTISGGFTIYIIAILISIMNILMKKLIIEPFFNR